MQNTFNPVGFDWSKGSQNIGGTIYAPQMAPAYVTDEAGNTVYTETGVPALLMEGPDSESAQYVMRPKGYTKYDEADFRPGGSFEVYDLSGKLLGREAFTRDHFGSRGFFGDLFELATGLAKEYAPLATMAIGAGPLGGMIGSAAASGLGITGLTAAQTAALGSAIGSGGITALSGGDIGDVLKSAAMAGAPQFIPKDINAAINAARAIESGNPLALARIASSYLPGPTMPGAGTSEDIQEGFFEPGGPGFMPTEYLDDAEVDRELTSLLGRYPAPPPPSDWFLGENIMSGVPEWDMAAVNAGLPIGNLEQDFSVAQTKEGPRIVDSAGNVGNFVNGEFVVDTGVTPNLSYAAASAPATGKAPGKAPAAPSKAPAAPSGPAFDPNLLFALGMMMTPQQQKQQEEQMVSARAVPSPFGMDLLV